ncbi:rhamnulokinase family protein [Alicyclobacillus sp. SO9]|uniref:rhamnulokinase n=1 Tax=Alicyclobacillus sp. SO9 TaxID=2665646 RepID=UPI001E295A59|nr:rhamnulokinase family protein [Alicyclobacillus sp. SO9]
MLTIDLGASSGRVMNAGFDGERITLTEVHRFPNKPFRIFDGMYWNVYAIYEEIRLGMTKANSLGAPISGLGIDSWAVDFGLVDSSGHLLTMPGHYRDPRNTVAMSEVIGTVGRHHLFHRTGIQLSPINTLYQLYAAKVSGYPLLDGSETLLLIPNLVSFFLTGQRSAEFTNATTTQLLRAMSLEWDTELMNQLQIPSSILPDVKLPGTVVDVIHDSELTGLSLLSQTKVIHTASHDTASAVVAVPHEDKDYAYISSGTWSLVGTVVDRPVITEQTENFNFTNEGGLGNYRLLKNVMGLWLLQETQAVFQKEDYALSLPKLLHLADTGHPFQFLFDPDDPRLLQPLDMLLMIRQICLETGQGQPVHPGDVVRSILESLALKYRYVLEELEMITGKRYNAIHVVGGGSRNQLLSQFTASATNREVIAGPVEASTLGNAAVQLLALGEIASPDEIQPLIRASVEIRRYVPHQQQAWDEAYNSFRKVMELQRLHSQS